MAEKTPDFKELDLADELNHFREEFVFPNHPSKSSEEKSPVIYLCGNSLGLQPKGTSALINNCVKDWAEYGVDGYMKAPNWLTTDSTVKESMAAIVGAKPSEVAIMNTLTANIHFMFASFYKPTKEKFKIVIEKKAFPSDIYATQSQLIHHGFDPSVGLIQLEPREGEVCLRTEDILSAISREADSIAVVFLSGIQYYTGQLFDIPTITSHAQKLGCTVGWDLAHAAGNVILNLHDWNVDFACWCTYKYLNSGPAAMGACFVHEKHTNNSENQLERLSGWWGNSVSNRFQMQDTFVPEIGADGFRVSCCSPLMISCIRGSLDVFDKVGMEKLRNKSVKLTLYLEKLVDQELSEDITILTPRDPNQRGAQLSLCFKNFGADVIFNKLQEKGVICDLRRPSVIRIAPAPMYNSFEDVWRFVHTVKSIVNELNELK